MSPLAAEGRIRVVALGVVVSPGREAFLVSRGSDPQTGASFERLLGGKVEFGETGAEALRRELLEEIGTETLVGERLAVIENRFHFDGRARHEVLLVYRADFVDPADYERDFFSGLEDEPVDAFWRAIRAAPGAVALYPAGVDALVAGAAGT